MAVIMAVLALALMPGRMRFLEVIDDHIGPDRGDPAALNRLEAERIAVDTERGDGIGDGIGIGAGIDQRCHDHVAGHPGGTVEPDDALRSRWYGAVLARRARIHRRVTTRAGLGGGVGGVV